DQVRRLVLGDAVMKHRGGRYLRSRDVHVTVGRRSDAVGPYHLGISRDDMVLSVGRYDADFLGLHRREVEIALIIDGQAAIVGLVGRPLDFLAQGGSGNGLVREVRRPNAIDGTTAQRRVVDPLGVDVHRDPVTSNLDDGGLAVAARNGQILVVYGDRNVLGNCRSVALEDAARDPRLHVDDDDRGLRAVATRTDVLVSNVELAVLAVDDDILRLRAIPRDGLRHIVDALKAVSAC